MMIDICMFRCMYEYQYMLTLMIDDADTVRVRVKVAKQRCDERDLYGSASLRCTSKWNLESVILT